MNIIPSEFLPAERESSEEIKRQVEIVSDVMAVNQYIQALPDIFVILNDKRQIVFANRPLSGELKEEIDEIIGKRPGEALFCQHAFYNSGGCGTSKFCAECGAAKAIMSGINGEADVQECRILVKDTNEAMDLKVWSKPIVIGCEQFVILTVQDISSEKRVKQLERIFFHDILNAAGGLKGVAEMLQTVEEPNEAEYFRNMIVKLSAQIIEEVQAQRQLIAAESGEIKVKLDSFSVNALLTNILETYKFHLVAENKTIEIKPLPEDYAIVSDLTILKRALGNMLKNALESVGDGATVKIGTEMIENNIRFFVWNPSYIPENVQLQIFQRSFSTKGNDRGLGTYSIKLLVERYLNGKVGFTSSEENGTEFFAIVPKKMV